MSEKSECRHLFTLVKLAEMGAHRRTAKISTEYLAEKLNISQQTASRYLIELDRSGWIKRGITPEGCLIRITHEGIKELNKLYSTLRFLMDATYPPSITLEGTVFTGLGEGAYYISKEKYRKQFIEKLGFDPYPGTLNLRLTTDYDVKARNELEAYPSCGNRRLHKRRSNLWISKMLSSDHREQGKRRFDLDLRSHYDASVLEIIAPVPLRKHLNLKDGRKVKVEVLTLP